MKQLSRLTILICACAALALTATAGPESSGKEMKQVAPAPPPPCDWTGFYLGLHVGGQFGHAEDKDLDGYNFLDKPWGYSQSGVVAGGQVGYNWQWNWLVLGPEFDIGYMNIDGSGHEPGSPNADTRGESSSDFYTTLRGRAGVAFGSWLFYATGGAIGVNWDTRVVDNCDVEPCGTDTLDARKQEFDWGWTVGGGIEHMFGCHWSLKVEYLYYVLDAQTFNGAAHEFDGDFDGQFNFRANNEGNIVRAGLNYKF
jgi:outer membrane immunogenic protein